MNDEQKLEKLKQIIKKKCPTIPDSRLSEFNQHPKGKILTIAAFLDDWLKVLGEPSEQRCLDCRKRDAILNKLKENARQLAEADFKRRYGQIKPEPVKGIDQISGVGIQVNKPRSGLFKTLERIKQIIEKRLDVEVQWIQCDAHSSINVQYKRKDSTFSYRSFQIPPDEFLRLLSMGGVVEPDEPTIPSQVKLAEENVCDCNASCGSDCARCGLVFGEAMSHHVHSRRLPDKVFCIPCATIFNLELRPRIGKEVEQAKRTFSVDAGLGSLETCTCPSVLKAGFIGHEKACPEFGGEQR